MQNPDERVKDPDERIRGVPRWVWWLFVAAMMIVVIFLWRLPGPDDADVGSEPDLSASTTTAVGGLGEDIAACERPGAWDRTPNVVVEESSERGTRTVGTVDFTNTSDEDIRLWWQQSATTGDGEVSVAWRGGSILLPGDTKAVPASHAVLNTGVESWVLPLRAYALSAEGDCFLLGEAVAPEGDAGSEVDLVFGPNG